MAGDVIVAGVDLATHGFRLGDVARSGWSVTHPSAAVAARAGLVPVANPRIGAGDLGLTGWIEATSLSQFRTRAAALATACGSGAEVVVSLPRLPGVGAVRVYARLTAVRRTGRVRGRDYGDLPNLLVPAEVRFRLLDPAVYAEAVTCPMDIGATAVDLSLGTAPTVRDHAWTITGVAGASNPVIEIETEAGSSVTRTTVNTTLGASDVLTIDHDAGTISKGTSSALADLGTDSDFPVVLDPRTMGSAPKIKVTSTGAQVTMEACYRVADIW